MARKAIAPELRKTSHTATFHPADHDFLVELGEGNLSAGIEEAVIVVRKVLAAGGIVYKDDEVSALDLLS